ncbi:acylneuraminate cytidylyltransferase family protein [Hyphomicrobium sp. xq]|uniref:Acylneuraminate cytidylyltransferase family protein n=1 Tax=Hyphomicrobium album TaxID=2665159 RepID=A0A6I3KPP7_9HYPH|nr:acylneuraminate cytidylyltransferase family protein [Hyphomicrobium album]MTD94671.1 acylneuraminate cytidylyltransferase family protein [Hyphomicrobium album]
MTADGHTGKGYLAIVTARAGSKRLPGKNVRDLCGKPLFVWSVASALDCPEIARVIVTTDSREYQSIAREAGADCPWLRDAALAADSSTSADVVRDVLDRLGAESATYKGLVLLQPTSPLRTAADISAAIALRESHGASAVVSVSEAECPPAWVGRIPENLCMDGFRSSAPAGNAGGGTWWRLNGAVYVIGIADFLSAHDFMPQGTLAYQMPRERSVDVDTEFDLELARLLMSRNRRGS